MLLWVNNHYSDFEGDPVMEDYLGTFEKGLELQVSNRGVPCLFVSVSGGKAGWENV